MPPKGEMWNYFTTVDKIAKKAECNYCKKIFSYKTTSANLKNHLKHKHITIYSKISREDNRNENSGARIVISADPASEDFGVAVYPVDIGGGGGDDAIESGSNDSNMHPFSRSDPLSQNTSKKTKLIRKGRMWKYFTVVDKIAKKAECKYCKKIFSYKTTSANLKNHLKRRHITIYSKISREDNRNENSGARIVISAEPASEDFGFAVYPGDIGGGGDDAIESGSNDSNMHPFSRSDPLSQNTSKKTKLIRKGRMWKYFTVVDKIAKKAECKYCKKTFSYKTTSANLKNHLKVKHLTIYAKISRESNGNENSGAGIADPAVSASEDIGVAVNSIVIGGGDGDDGSDAITSGSNDRNVHPFSRSGPSSQNPLKKQCVKASCKKTNLDKLLLNMIAIDCQPFSIVDDEGFKSFVYGLNPNYNLPDRKTLSATLLAREYEERLATIKSVVSTECSSMCISVDCWTSRTMQPYIAITGHFINKTTLDFKSTLLQCSLLDGTHTGENIAQAISSAICEWDLTDKINSFVTDNAPNMLSAANILGYSHYECYAHTLNLIAQNALALPDVDSTIGKIKKIVAHFKRSSQAKEELLRYQINSQGIAEGSALTLIMSVPTRWISTYLMLQRFVHLQESIKATVPNLNVDLTVISLQEWRCLEQICEVLKPLYEATLIMSGDNYLTASKAFVITQGLLNMYAQMTSNNTFHAPAQNLAKNIDVSLKQRLWNINDNLHITVCTFLDPRFKQFAFDNEKLGITKKYIIEEICNIIGEDQPSTIPESCEPGLSLWNLIDQRISASQKPRSTYTKVLDEIDMYLRQVVINSESCPLEWWRGHKTIYPSLFLIFVKYFNIIVTSVPCERAFSKAGHLFNDRRTRLTSSKVAKLMFLHGNKNF